MLRIDVNSSRQLQAVVLAVRAASNTVAREYRQRLKGMTDAAWTDELRGRTSTRLQARVLLGSARTRVSDQNVQLSVGTVGRALSKRTGGAGAVRPVDLIRAVEFGGSQTKYSDYQRRSKRGGRHDVRRRTLTGFGGFVRKGNTVYPALGVMVPRIAALMVQTCVRTLQDALEGKR
jgi:hypothetical protein